MNSRIPVIIDSDGGIDDSAALWWMTSCGLFEIVAITVVYGNVPLRQAANNIVATVRAAGLHGVPVALGAESSLAAKPIKDHATHIHGDSGLGDRRIDEQGFSYNMETASDLIVRLCNERPGEISVLGLGPATNIALALRQDHYLASKIMDMTYMGGTVHPPGNITPVATFNVGSDPVAAKEMFEADWQRPPLLVPFDTSIRCTMGSTEFELADLKITAAAEFLADPLAYYRESTRMQMPTESRGSELAIHDALTAMTLAFPDIVEVKQLPVTVDVGGDAAWGMTVVDHRAKATNQVTSREPESLHYRTPFKKSIWRLAINADTELFRKNLRKMFGESE